MRHSFLIAIASLTALVGCASSSAGPSACTTNADCNSNQMCVYPIGSCSATAQCVDRPTGPMCNSVIEYCGCGGAMVVGGCGFPQGYASGPTTGTSGNCGNDGGTD